MSEVRQTVALIDYGMGNLHSAAKALEHVGSSNTRVIVSSNPEIILKADRVILPGVGAIRDCMSEIRKLGLDTVIRDVVSQHTPLLGICVGMQLLLDYSEENGGVECLGLVKGQVRRFDAKAVATRTGERIKVPHMGWNQVIQEDHVQHPLWKSIPDLSRFYFVHSFFVELNDVQQRLCRCEYGTYQFAAGLEQGSTVAVQFHPEKSHTFGLQLLKNFLSWKPPV